MKYSVDRGNQRTDDAVTSSLSRQNDVAFKWGYYYGVCLLGRSLKDESPKICLLHQITHVNIWITRFFVGVALHDKMPTVNG